MIKNKFGTIGIICNKKRYFSFDSCNELNIFDTKALSEMKNSFLPTKEGTTSQVFF